MNDHTRYQPVTGGLPVPPTPPRRKPSPVLLIGTGVLIAVFVLVVAAIVTASGPSSTTPAEPPRVARGFAKATSTAPASTALPAPPPVAADFTVTLKVTSKKCFGSAGCNVVVEPQLAYAGVTVAWVDRCDVTYTVSGDESGDVVATAYSAGGLDFRVYPSVLSTRSSRVTPAATVTGVSCR